MQSMLKEARFQTVAYLTVASRRRDRYFVHTDGSAGQKWKFFFAEGLTCQNISHAFLSLKP